RSFPYTTNTALNPLSFGDLLGVSEEHAIGEVWAQALWEVYWGLVEAHGFDPDLASGGGGNGMALQLAIDALKLQGCEPTYVVARDAILDADLIDHDGANACRIWQAFAKRGLGVGASAGSGPSSTLVSEDFGVPAACEIACGNGSVESGEGCDDGGTFAGDGCSPSCQPEPGFGCAGSPSVCTATCGDGVVAGGEGCDDGGTLAGDGCGASCQPEPGFGCAGSPSVCMATCGDGLVLGGEGCDDGGTFAGDGCDPACEVEPGFGCSGQPSVCVPGAAVPALTREGLALLALALAATARFGLRRRGARRAGGEC
ncbi:MAG TPA: M36 family metallopeptidase, partial [Myxococcota bacterium]|nr:M36 family metallopeptidase [Myxococcota bacterium]